VDFLAPIGNFHEQSLAVGRWSSVVSLSFSDESSPMQARSHADSNANCAAETTGESRIGSFDQRLTTNDQRPYKLCHTIGFFARIALDCLDNRAAYDCS